VGEVRVGMGFPDGGVVAVRQVRGGAVTGGGAPVGFVAGETRCISTITRRPPGVAVESPVAVPMEVVGGGPAGVTQEVIARCLDLGLGVQVVGFVDPISHVVAEDGDGLEGHDGDASVDVDGRGDLGPGLGGREPQKRQ